MHTPALFNIAPASTACFFPKVSVMKKTFQAINRNEWIESIQHVSCYYVPEIVKIPNHCPSPVKSETLCTHFIDIVTCLCFLNNISWNYSHFRAIFSNQWFGGHMWLPAYGIPADNIMYHWLLQHYKMLAPGSGPYQPLTPMSVILGSWVRII